MTATGVAGRMIGGAAGDRQQGALAGGLAFAREGGRFAAPRHGRARVTADLTAEAEMAACGEPSAAPGIVPLSTLRPGEGGLVADVLDGAFGAGLRARLRAMGIVPPRPVSVIRRAWLGGPLVVRVGPTTIVAIRPSEAALVLVTPT